jgi:hypothetical protein
MKKFLLLAFFIFLLLASISLAKPVKKEEETPFECDIKGNKLYCEMPPIYLKKQINVFGTEYFPSSTGTIYFQVLDNGLPVDNASCVLTVYYPDKTKWIDNAPMYFLENGLYFYDIQVPEEPLGTYMISSYCWYIINIAKYFPYYLNITTGSSSGSFPSGLYEMNDGITHSVKEKTDTLYFEYWFNVSVPQNLTEIHINFYGSWDDNNENVEIFVFNYYNNSWVKLTNPIRSSSVYVAVNNLLEDNLYNYFNNSILKVRFKDTSSSTGKDSTLMIDFFQVELVYLTGQFIDDIRGGGEIHISNVTAYIPPISPNVTVNVTVPINVSLENISELINETVEPKLDDLIALMFALHSTPVTRQYCIDNQTLVTEKVANWTVAGKIYPITKNETVLCNWGCDVERNECRSAPYIGVLYAFGIVIILIILILIFKRYW